MPVISSIRKLRQGDYRKFKASQNYTESTIKSVSVSVVGGAGKIAQG